MYIQVHSLKKTGNGRNIGVKNIHDLIIVIDFLLKVIGDILMSLY